MRKNLFLGTILSLSLILVVGGCSSKKSGSKLGEGQDGMSESDINALQESRYGSGSIPTAEGEGLFRDVHFNYDSADVSGEAMQNIEYNAQVLQRNPSLRVQLEGHCDERGTAEYNLALGSRRARAVYDVLTSLGSAANRLDSISYGEEVPLDPSHSEAAYARNRRVHFSAYENR